MQDLPLLLSINSFVNHELAAVGIVPGRYGGDFYTSPRSLTIYILVFLKIYIDSHGDYRTPLVPLCNVSHRISVCYYRYTYTHRV